MFGQDTPEARSRCDTYESSGSGQDLCFADASMMDANPANHTIRFALGWHSGGLQITHLLESA
jgi:hypothetical protein